MCFFLEYCSPIWSPIYKNDINKLEAVQRRFTKRLRGCAHWSYEERLQWLEADTLELRRLKLDLVTMFKVIKGIIDVDASDFFEFSQHDICTRGHNFKIVQPACNNNARAFSFACRNVKCWNALPSYVVNAQTVAAFKTYLNYCNFKPFLYLSK